MTKAKKIEKLVEFLLEYRRRVTGREGRAASSCIGDTRIAVEVMRAHGIRAVPLVVGLEAFSPAFVEMRKAKERGEEIDLDVWRERGAHIVSIGMGGADPNTRGYDNHLVAVIEGGLLLDLTLDQASRPDKGMPLTPSSFAVARDFASRQQTAAFIANTGVVITYESRPKVKDFLTAPDWAGLVKTSYIRDIVRQSREVV